MGWHNQGFHRNNTFTPHSISTHVAVTQLSLHQTTWSQARVRWSTVHCTGQATTTTRPQFLFHHAVTFPLSSHPQSCPLSTLLLYLFYNSGQKQPWDKTFKLFLISMSMSRLETGELETSIVHGNQTKHTSIRRDKKLKMFTLELKCKPADVVMLKSSSWFNNLHLSNNIAPPRLHCFGAMEIVGRQLTAQHKPSLSFSLSSWFWNYILFL